MYSNRIKYYRDVEAYRSSKVLVYITGDRKNLETQIHPEVLDFFSHHLDGIGETEKISLILYTRGGHTLAAWSIANLINQFSNQFEVIVPSKAHSGGTLICLGADPIIMTKQATLGPIDPSVNTALNPQVPGASPNNRVPVSVEAINGYIELAKEHGIDDPDNMVDIFRILANKVHPLVLGKVYRTRSQIRMLGKSLLSRHMDDEEKINSILSFLCSESGSHDYTIYRGEAKHDLGLNIEEPDANLYNSIKSIYNDISNELKLTDPFVPPIALAGKDNIQYSHTRALIESVDGGSHKFISQGQLEKVQIKDNQGKIQTNIRDNRTFEGWKHEEK